MNQSNSYQKQALSSLVYQIALGLSLWNLLRGLFERDLSLFLGVYPPVFLILFGVGSYISLFVRALPQIVFVNLVAADLFINAAAVHLLLPTWGDLQAWKLWFLGFFAFASGQFCLRLVKQYSVSRGVSVRISTGAAWFFGTQSFIGSVVASLLGALFACIVPGVWPIVSGLLSTASAIFAIFFLKRAHWLLPLNLVFCALAFGGFALLSWI